MSRHVVGPRLSGIDLFTWRMTPRRDESATPCFLLIPEHGVDEPGNSHGAFAAIDAEDRERGLVPAVVGRASILARIAAGSGDLDAEPPPPDRPTATTTTITAATATVAAAEAHRQRGRRQYRDHDSQAHLSTCHDPSRDHGGGSPGDTAPRERRDRVSPKGHPTRIGGSLSALAFRHTRHQRTGVGRGHHSERRPYGRRAPAVGEGCAGQRSSPIRTTTRPGPNEPRSRCSLPKLDAARPSVPGRQPPRFRPGSRGQRHRTSLGPRQVMKPDAK